MRNKVFKAMCKVPMNLQLFAEGGDGAGTGDEGGNGGGTLVCEGTPEEICDCEKSYTGQFLKPALEKSKRIEIEP